MSYRIFSDIEYRLAGLQPKYPGELTISPDGDWIVLIDDSLETKNFFAIPVEPKNPLFLGNPIRLGWTKREDAKMQSYAWTTKPCAFVFSDGLVLYKWELG